VRRVSLMAVVIGGIVDIGGTSLAGLPVVAYVMATGGILALPQAEQTAAVMAFIKGHTGLYVLLAIFGTLCSVLGGYVSALLARRSELLNAALSSYLCLALGIWTLASGQEQMPTWLFLSLLPLSPLFAGLGGYLRVVQTRARTRAAGPGVPSSAA
jgi:hypothetical protein